MKKCKMIYMLLFLFLYMKLSAMTLMIPDTSATVGSSITIPINVSDTTNSQITGIEILLSYNNTILDITGINKTTLTSSFIISDSIGVFSIAITLARSTGVIITSGKLIEIEFQINNNANVHSTTPINFMEVNIYDENNNAVPLELINGSITVLSMPEEPHEELTVIPNPFTPNNDNYNDVVNFNLSSGMTYNQSEIKIFDISGKLIRNIDQGLNWNGLDNDGNPSKPGVYIYLVKINEKKFNGTITLVR